MNSVLVDTNVWVDIVLKRPDFVEDSLGAVMVCIDKGVRLLVVGTSVKDVFIGRPSRPALMRAIVRLTCCLALLILPLWTTRCVNRPSHWKSPTTKMALLPPVRK